MSARVAGRLGSEKARSPQYCPNQIRHGPSLLVRASRPGEAGAEREAGRALIMVDVRRAGRSAGELLAVVACADGWQGRCNAGPGRGMSSASCI